MRASVARRGFTLIELLVVITIIVGLMAMIALAAPRFAERQGPSRGAMQLQSWLNLARQMAIRDQRPRGIRILPPTPPVPIDANYSTELRYLEVPEDFYPAPIGGTAELYFPALLAGGKQMPYNYTAPKPVPDYRWALIAVVDRYSTTPPATIPVLPPDPNATVKIGDVLNVTGTGEGVTFGGGVGPRLITAVRDGGIGFDPSGKSAHLYYIQLDRPADTPPTNGPPNWFKPHTGQYAIYRQAQPMAGEPVLQLPRDVGIDFSRDPNTNDPTKYTWSRFFPLIGTGGGLGIDILFNTNGSVLSFGGLPPTTNRICLWVRDVSQPWNTPGQVMQLPPGDNSLVTVFTRTGMVVSHPIATTYPGSGISLLTPKAQPWGQPWPPKQPTWNPFYFTQDNQLSGQ
jgi:prepilin-type N-terminal cleavage/methylation domain-containing protein